MFVGPRAFPQGEIPEVYASIGRIEPSPKHIWYLMEPGRLIELIDRRKNKSEQNFTINDKLNEEYYCRKYFEFLGELVLSLDFKALYQQDHVKFFIVLAARVCSQALLGRLFWSIVRMYGVPVAFCLELILEDLKHLSGCGPEYSFTYENDDYLLFLTRFLICIKTKPAMEVEPPPKRMSMLAQIERLFASDSPTFSHCTEILQSIFLRFMKEVMADFSATERESLRQSFENFLVEAQAVSTGFGMVLLRLVMDLHGGRSMHPEKILFICKKINCHALAQLELEQLVQEGCQWAIQPLDSLARLVSQDDLLGLRMLCTENRRLRVLMLNLQQRE
jgi:hypothetical protein